MHAKQRSKFMAHLSLTCSLLHIVTLASVRADIVGIRVLASDGGVADTIGGNGYYNIYFSQDGGQSFVNYGDDPATTAIDLPTTPGVHTYEFYYSNSRAGNLEMSFDFTLGLGLAVESGPDQKGFSPLRSQPYQDGNDLVTLTAYTWTNAGGGPAAPFSVDPGNFNNYSPEISGSFTYVSVGKAIPEPSTVILAVVGITTGVCIGCSQKPTFRRRLTGCMLKKWVPVNLRRPVRYGRY